MSDLLFLVVVAGVIATLYLTQFHKQRKVTRRRLLESSQSYSGDGAGTGHTI